MDFTEENTGLKNCMPCCRTRHLTIMNEYGVYKVPLSKYQRSHSFFSAFAPECARFGRHPQRGMWVPYVSPFQRQPTRRHRYLLHVDFKTHLFRATRATYSKHRRSITQIISQSISAGKLPEPLRPAWLDMELFPEFLDSGHFLGLNCVSGKQTYLDDFGHFLGLNCFRLALNSSKKKRKINTYYPKGHDPSNADPRTLQRRTPIWRAQKQSNRTLRVYIYI